MAIDPLAGQPVPPDRRPNIPRLLRDYYQLEPGGIDGEAGAPIRPEQRVAFGTSGHRGTSSDGSFNEVHIVAICAAIAELRRERGIAGPLFLGKDTHALSEAAHGTAIEVFAAHDVALRLNDTRGATPTPVISHAILTHNAGSNGVLADGVVITPSHNPPEDGGIKYNPPTGGPADTETTRRIQDRANVLIEGGTETVRRLALRTALARAPTRWHDFWTPYVTDLSTAIDMDAIRGSDLRIGADPMGGAALDVWERIADVHGVVIDVVNRVVDPSFSFMRLDHDGRIRMDCSSPWAMAGLVELKNRYDVAFGNDPDADRHGIVTPAGLMNPNHFLAVAVDYLFRHREGWGGEVAVGKTLVSSSMIDRVAAALGRAVVEVPVGFKWFVEGLLEGSLGFAGEESAGASFLRRDGTVWTTDKDGILLNLLAAEITAVTGRDPAGHYQSIEERFGTSTYARIDAPATREQKAALRTLSPRMVATRELAGDPITETLTRAPGNGAGIGGLKVATENGWFAARPSGTEDIYKIYAESFRGDEHLRRIQEEARTIVERALDA
ncbi:MAG: phosphoglucomutase (alpha-D-glucose-1,6-bisphosphate-dependent) [Longimicrobiales bacterium]